MLTLNVDQAVGIAISIAACFTLLGAGIGYYACAKDEEKREQKVLDHVATIPNRTIDPKSLVIGMAYEKMIQPPQ